MNRLWKLFFGQGLSRTRRGPRRRRASGRRTRSCSTGWRVEFVDERLGREAAGAHARHVGGLPAELAASRRARREGPRQPALRAPVALPARRRDGARQRAGGQRAASSRGSAGRASIPYQPRGYWAYLNFPPREWDDSPGEDQYRRGLYTWWQRTLPAAEPRRLRRAEPRGVRGRARALERAAAGARAAQRPDATSRPRASSPSASCARAGRASRRASASPTRGPCSARRPRQRSAFSRSCCASARQEFARDRAAAGRLVAVGQRTAATGPDAGRARGLDAGGAGDPEPARADHAVLSMRPCEILTDDVEALRERLTRRAFLGRGGAGLGASGARRARRPAPAAGRGPGARRHRRRPAPALSRRGRSASSTSTRRAARRTSSCSTTSRSSRR